MIGALTSVQFGEAAAVGTAVLWTFSALAWTSSGRCVGALAISFWRLVLAIGMLTSYGYVVRGMAWPSDATLRIWLLLGLSGFMGFFISDLCLFKAFLIIGPRLSLLVTSLTPPMVVLLSWAFYGRGLDGRVWLAMAITLAGVLWVALEQRDGDDHPHTRRQLRFGITLAVVATAAQSVGMVLAQDGCAHYDPSASALVRILGALVGYFLLITVLRRWRPMLHATQHRRAAIIVLFGTIVGPFAGVTLCMVALQHCHVGVVSTILATIPVMILPFSIFLYGEQVSLRAIFGALLAVAGVALLMLPSNDADAPRGSSAGDRSVPYHSAQQPEAPKHQ